MSMFKWDVVDPAPGEAVAPHQRLAWGKTAGLGAQHVIAMFGATFVFPIIMGLNANLAIMMSGIATICFLLIVGGRVPSYLGTSASFVGGAAAIYAHRHTVSNRLERLHALTGHDPQTPEGQTQLALGLQALDVQRALTRAAR